MGSKNLGTVIIIFSLLVGTIAILYLVTRILWFTVPANVMWFLIFAILLVLFLTISAIRYGKKLYSIPQVESRFDNVDNTVITDQITVKVTIQKKEYIKLSYTLTYANLLNVFVSIVGVFMLGFVLQYFLFPVETDDFPFLPLLIFVYSLIFTPLSIYYEAIKNMKTMALLKETVYYTFSSEDVHIKCESIDTNIKWNVIKSIKELNNWYILYVGKNRGYFIPKSQFSSGIDESNFRYLVLSKTTIKQDLK